MRWKIFDGALNAGLLIDFMDRLVRDADRKIHLILGTLRVHHARPVKAWLAGHGESIKVHDLPSYSPELNANELLNAEVKQVGIRQAPACTKPQLLRAASRHLRSMQRRPERIRRLIQDQPCRINKFGALPGAPGPAHEVRDRRCRRSLGFLEARSFPAT
jgi:transposase